MLGGDEVYICAAEAAAVVKVVLWRTGGLDSRRRCWSSRPHPTHAWLMRSLAANSLSRLHCEAFSVFTTNIVNTTKLCKTTVLKMTFLKCMEMQYNCAAERQVYQTSMLSASYNLNSYNPLNRVLPIRLRRVLKTQKIAAVSSCLWCGG